MASGNLVAKPNTYIEFKSVVDGAPAWTERTTSNCLRPYGEAARPVESEPHTLG